jgi:hypothetical protein
MKVLASFNKTARRYRPLNVRAEAAAVAQVRAARVGRAVRVEPAIGEFQGRCIWCLESTFWALMVWAVSRCMSGTVPGDVTGRRTFHLPFGPPWQRSGLRIGPRMLLLIPAVPLHSCANLRQPGSRNQTKNPPLYLARFTAPRTALGQARPTSAPAVPGQP